MFHVSGGVTSVWCYIRCYKCLMLHQVLHVFDVTWGVTSVWCYMRCYKCLMLHEVLQVFDVTWGVTSVWCDIRCYKCLMLKRCYTCLIFRRCYSVIHSTLWPRWFNTAMVEQSTILSSRSAMSTNWSLLHLSSNVQMR